jgi:peptidoglycan/xylan/chitin deacetylase (PgdA/CDA1 family)
MRVRPDVLDQAELPARRPIEFGRAGTVAGHYVSSGLPGVLLLPALAIAGAPVHASAFQCAISVLIALVAFGVAARFAARRALAPLAIVGAGCGAWLLAQASYPVAAWLVAPVFGFGAGLAFDDRAFRIGDRGPRGVAAQAALAGGAVIAGLVLLRLITRDAAMAAAAFYVALATACRLAEHGSARGGRVSLAGFAALALLLPLGTSAYIGATTPRVTWFGSLVSHGPRSGNQVAITFDDGPDPPYTLEIAAILDQYGAKGTFFTVGKALDKRPDVSRALLADGQLLGNHSYSHDAVKWLDPRYPELQKTQDAFQRNLGVCPAFYRPPHGSHTPFMAHVVADHGMTMITWDDSAGDWATNDDKLVAKRILDHVHAGSIILLHDGSDGNIGAADRSVILRALPVILEGLKQRGLHSVTLDKLLGKPGYVPCS